MKSRFNTVKDYLTNIKAATKAHLNFVGKATSLQMEDDDEGDRWRERIYITPALDGEEWDQLNRGNTAYVIGSDGYRLHVAIVPVLHVEGSVLSYESSPYLPAFGRVINTLSIDETECVYLNAKFLREAIHPDADEVAIHVPAGALAQSANTEVGSPSAVQVVSLCNDTQIAWAAVMPLTFYRNFRPAPQIHLPQLLTAEEVRERIAQQKAEAEQRFEEVQTDEIGQGQPAFVAA